jgi:hypothetical protein
MCAGELQHPQQFWLFQLFRLARIWFGLFLIVRHNPVPAVSARHNLSRAVFETQNTVPSVAASENLVRADFDRENPGTAVTACQNPIYAVPTCQ